MGPCPNREAEVGCRLLKYMPPGRTRQLCNGSLHQLRQQQSEATKLDAERLLGQAI